jgi:hypothetical protein
MLKECPLNNKERLDVVLHVECNYWVEKGIPEVCRTCPFQKGLMHIPLIRRAYPKLIAQEIFGVQPMEGSLGITFGLSGMTYKFGEGDKNEKKE